MCCERPGEALAPCLPNKKDEHRFKSKIDAGDGSPNQWMKKEPETHIGRSKPLNQQISRPFTRIHIIAPGN